jgi:GDP-L-fucose synthase
MDRKKILITGGTGLVGSAIKHISKTFDHHLFEFVFLSSSDYNLCNLEDTIGMFTEHRPHYVIHLAANVGGLYKNMNQKVDMLEKNLIMNYNVVKCSHDFKVEKLIACLSTCIFPDKVDYPITESDLHNGPPHSSNDAYAYAKRILEIHCRAYRENYGDDFVCIIPTNIYGPNDNFDLDDGHVLPALIHKCYLAKKEKKPFVVRGSGKPLRQFIYSRDLAQLIMKVLFDFHQDNIILSVPESHETTIAHVGFAIAKAFEYEEHLEFDTNFADGQYKKTVSAQKLMDLIGDEFKFTDIEEGITTTVEWFLENKV